jgi:DNA repair exonuclease SbcCD nuclease subunit/ABC-type Mn2+/Zn2+ transport system ATPase subunit|tara:strand:+ start:393 stop:3500 length:3108 start_codon:yes stop_codon:yes gene_type:complete
VKFAHISDTHIKNLKYHYEYRVVFEQLYEKLREEEVDYIVHCGDVAHTKTQISPEYVEMCSQFFERLANIAPTYAILGNHDGNLKNSSRQDALTPIFNALNHPDLHLLKDSGETMLDNTFCLNVLSVFDRDRWVKPTDTDKINIALYHGSISNCKTDINWTMTNGEDELNIFEDFDFAMLGDIHRRQFLDEEGRIWYAGSTVQQNHGETNDKGILIWEINDKDNWNIEPIMFKNPKPFITIELTRKGRMPKNISIPTGARLRLVSNNNLPLNTMKRAVDVARQRFNPEVITFLNRAAGERGDVTELTENLQRENLRDINVQEELIDEYLKDYQVDGPTMEKIYELNRKYKKAVEDDDDISRNVNWKLTNFEYDNLFNYGEKNSVRFNELNGITGIFGKNFSGKSSIIDAMLWTLFNTTSKNERKNLNVINQNKDSCYGKVSIQIGERTYTVTRTAEKYVKRLKGEETLEAKTDLNFEMEDPVTGETISLNGLTRNNTDAMIRKHFGTIDDFLVSSMASQHGALSFIDEGSTRRKEIIAKFLDLEIFDKKFKLSKEDSVDTKAILKKLDDNDYDTEVKEAEEELSSCRNDIDAHLNVSEAIESERQSLNNLLLMTAEKISSMPTEAINIYNIREGLKECNNKVFSLTGKMIEDKTVLTKESERLGKIKNLMNSLDYNDLLEKKQTINNLNKKLENLGIELETAIKKEKLLDGIPCGTNYPTCKFIRDAHVSVATMPELDLDMGDASAKLSDLGPALVEDHISKYLNLDNEKQKTEYLIKDLKISLERNNVALERLNNTIKEYRQKEISYEENKEAIENLEILLKEKENYENDIERLKRKINGNKSETLDLYKRVGSLEQRVENLREQQTEFLRLQQEFAAHDLFMRCMHPNGIAYDIIKKKIPVINSEIAKVLANIVDFEVFFESNGNKFDIFIKHPRHEPRPIEMASGAEKTMASMAIRLSLLTVSSLPKGDLFILDEPGTALDEENMEGFIRILELIKVYFKNVLLISHLDSLKDCVDMQIVIEKKDGYARVNQ